jgi:DNA-binding GntR family transcriptional regulator
VYAELELLNTQFSEAVEAGEIGRLNALNRSFHSRILSLAGKDLILEEVLRLWDMSGFYRSFYAYMLHADNRPAGRKLVEEHEAMLAALHAGDTERLVALSTEHRHSTRDGILRIVRPMGSFAYSPPVMS